MAIASAPVSESALDTVLAAAENGGSFDALLPTAVPEPGEPFTYEGFEAVALADPDDEAEEITGVGLAFGYAYEPDGDDDPDLDDFPQRDLGPEWIVDRDADADSLAATWRAVRDAVARRLGEPVYDEIEDEDEGWRRAAWLVGHSLICVGIGEDPGSYSLYNRAHLTVVTTPEEILADDVDEDLLDDLLGI